MTIYMDKWNEWQCYKEKTEAIGSTIAYLQYPRSGIVLFESGLRLVVNA